MTCMYNNNNLKKIIVLVRIVASSAYLETPGLMLELIRVFMITGPPAVRLTTYRCIIKKSKQPFLDLLIQLGPKASCAAGVIELRLLFLWVAHCEGETRQM